MPSAHAELSTAMFTRLWSALGGAPDVTSRVRFAGSGALASRFAVTDLAAATLATIGAAVSELYETAGHGSPSVVADRVLASAWCRPTPRAVGWTPRGGNSLTGEYLTRDGRWLRLQMNYVRQHDGALTTLGVGADRDAVARAVRGWDGQALEEAIAEGRGAAALCRTPEEWTAHPQGAAVESEPLVATGLDRGADGRPGWAPLPSRPLSGIRVLDMTRVLAGPTSTRYLAGFGAEVLRVDPPGYYEPRGGVNGTFGKRCSMLDIRTPDGRAQFIDLLSGADVLVHGYRSDALDGLGLDAGLRADVRPGLVEVALRAYGWSGPWSSRRGFDTLVEMANGMAYEGMLWAGANAPTLMPVQVLDFGTGHLMAAAAIRGLAHRLKTGQGSTWRLSLARTGSFLTGYDPEPEREITAADDVPLDPMIRMSALGPIRLPSPALMVEGTPQYWDRTGESYGASSARWAGPEGELFQSGNRRPTTGHTDLRTT